MRYIYIYISTKRIRISNKLLFELYFEYYSKYEKIKYLEINKFKVIEVNKQMNKIFSIIKNRYNNNNIRFKNPGMV